LENEPLLSPPIVVYNKPDVISSYEWLWTSSYTSTILNCILFNVSLNVITWCDDVDNICNISVGLYDNCSSVPSPIFKS
jgi:hypothetical protein